MDTRHSAESTSTLHNDAHPPQREQGQDVVANQVSGAEPKSTGVEQANNNVAELPGNNQSESTINERPTTTGKEPEKEETDKDWIVKFDENDPYNPKTMGKGRKWLITMVVAFSSLCV